MQYKKNKFIIFFVANVFLIIVIFLLAIFAYNFFNKISLNDNEVVKGQIIINQNKHFDNIMVRLKNG